MQEHHVPVLLNETIDLLNIKPNGIYVDGTVGFGGHSSQIAQRLDGSGRLFCIDQDPDALKFAGERLKNYDNITFVRGNFGDMFELITSQGIEKVDGVLLDIGVSSYQLDTPERGFSFHNDAPLDMRMSKQGQTAADLVNNLPEQELINILYDYGEEKFARRIVSSIIKHRSSAPINSTVQLAEIIKNAYPATARRDGHPARQTFQALRIAVNSELDVLKKGIEGAFDLLNEGGILAIITFHSLEDRIVKQGFAELCKGCICPPEFPVCVCNRTPRAQKVTGKPIIAQKSELDVNPRSRSAKLRAIKKLK